MRTVRRLLIRLCVVLLWGAVVCGWAGFLVVTIVGHPMGTLAAQAQALVRAQAVDHHAHYAPLSALGVWLPRATLAVEDRRFYLHGAVDLWALSRALVYDARHWPAFQGGGTIDEQLAERLLIEANIQGRVSFLTYGIDVIALASQLDGLYGKNGVLELYLNDIYYGSGAYGAAAAAKRFFGIQPADLSAAQAAFLAGLPNLPAVFGDHPTQEPAQERWTVVLLALERAGDLTPAQVARMKSTGLVLSGYN